MAQYMMLLSMFMSVICLVIGYPVYATYLIAMAVLFEVLYLVEEVKSGKY